MRVEALSLLEAQSQAGQIDLYYGDESKVCEEGYVPYGWQFADEKVSIGVGKGSAINCFGLITRDNKLIYSTTQESITADFIIEQIDKLSLQLRKMTVLVLDNASVHTADKVKERLKYWQQRGLFIFYLPPYCPHLNICERLWKELKARWLRPQDYQNADTLFYATALALAAVGNQVLIGFNAFKII